MKKDKEPTTQEMAAIDWLKKGFAKKGMVKSHLAEICGVTRQAVGDWAKHGQVDKKHFSAISDYIKEPIPSGLFTNIEALHYYHPVVSEKTDGDIVNNSINSYPLIAWGDIYKWSCSSMDKEVTVIELKKASEIVSEHSFWLEVVSDNMEPLILKGERVLVDPVMSPMNGDMALVNISGNEYAIRELVIDIGKMYIRSINRDWPTKLELVEKSSIKGLVIEKSVKIIRR